jgi:tripartite-type tricarboxylate transporter receptor subunit TctC
MRSFTHSVATIVCGVLAATALLTADAAAEVNFKGKKIDVIMGSSAGGGTDGTTRLVGRFLEKYLPGKPDMQYRNLPGGHGLKALNHFASAVKPDGLSWVGGSSAHIDANNLKKPQTKYNPTKFHFFGGVSRGGSIVFINSKKVKNLTDKSLQPVVVGELDGSRSWAQMIMFGQEALGWNVKFVIGYPGTSHLLLAVRRGEVDMIGTSNLKLLKDMFKSGEFQGVAQMGNPDESGEGVEGRSDFANVPVFDHLVEGKLKGAAKDSFEFWTMQNQLDKWYALPPGTPDEIVQAYRVAYDKVIKDPEFLKNAKLQFSEDFSPMKGELVQKLVAKTSYPDKALTDFIEEMKAKNGLPAEGLSDEQIAALAKEKGLDKMPTTQTTLKAVKDGGRSIEFEVDGKAQSADVSSSRTQITIAGKKAERKALKAGLVCEVAYPGDKQEATAITCK